MGERWREGEPTPVEGCQTHAGDGGVCKYRGWKKDEKFSLEDSGAADFAELAPIGSAAKESIPPLKRFTERAPDGTIILRYERKGKPTKEVVRPADLSAWQPIESIAGVELPIQFPPLPSAFVIDIETNGLNPAENRVLAVGLLFNFNDYAAARVTEMGRKVFATMLAAIEEAGGVVVEGDTDGVIVSAPHPEPILAAIRDALPAPFQFELEWQDAIVFVSDAKNSIVLNSAGALLAVKGSKWRGRDKPRYMTEFPIEFLRRYITKGAGAAMEYAERVRWEIASGNGWEWVVRRQKVGRGDVALINAGYKVGEKATYAYKYYHASAAKKGIARSAADGYDVDYYLREFDRVLGEVRRLVEMKE